jgi:hypothetical protein
VLISWLHFSPICLTVKIPHDVGSWPRMDKPFPIHDCQDSEFAEVMMVTLRCAGSKWRHNSDDIDDE